MTLRDYFASVLRTVVPAGVGFALTLLARKTGIVIDDATSASLTGAIMVIVAGAYYSLLRALEQRFPWLGVLLGWKASPTYGSPESGKL